MVIGNPFTLSIRYAGGDEKSAVARDRPLLWLIGRFCVIPGFERESGQKIQKQRTGVSAPHNLELTLGFTFRIQHSFGGSLMLTIRTRVSAALMTVLGSLLLA